MLKKILTAWCKFLSKSDSLYVLNESPSGWKSEAAQRAVGIEQFEHARGGTGFEPWRIAQHPAAAHFSTPGTNLPFSMWAGT